METERLTIIELYRKGKDQSEILKILNIPKTRRKFVYRTINRYKDTGTQWSKMANQEKSI